MFYIRFKIFIYWKMSELLIFAYFLFFGEQCERFDHNRSFPLSDVSKSLRSLTKNEQPWAIRSYRSEEMSDREWIAQVAHQKWANEWIPHFFERITHSLIFGQKTSDSLGKPMSEFPALHGNYCNPANYANGLNCSSANNDTEHIIFLQIGPSKYCNSAIYCYIFCLMYNHLTIMPVMLCNSSHYGHSDQQLLYISLYRKMLP